MRPGPGLFYALCYALLLEATAALVVVCVLALAHRAGILH